MSKDTEIAKPNNEPEIDYDKELKKIQLETARAELFFKKREIRGASGPWLALLRNPIVLGAIITAFITFNASIVGFMTSRLQASLEADKLKTQTELEKQKLLSQMALDRAKMESSLLTEIIKVGDPDRAAVNVKFFLDAGYLSDPDGSIRKSLEDRRPGEGHALPNRN